LKKILFFVDELGGRIGGAERVTIELANQLSSEGFDVTIATHQRVMSPPKFFVKPGVTLVDSRPVDSPENQDPEYLRKIGLVLQRAGLHYLAWLCLEWTKARGYKTIFRKFRPDYIFLVMPPAFSTGYKAFGGRRAKHVCMIHNEPQHEFGEDPNRWSQNKWDIRARKKMVERSWRNVVLQPSFIEQLPIKARDHALVIPNIVHFPESRLRQSEIPRDLKRKQQERNQGMVRVLTRDDPREVILYLGRLSPAKRIDILVRAWKICVEQGFANDFVLLIVGNGTEASALRKLRNELHLEDSCLFGPSTVDVGAYYGRASMFVIPSTFEGFGLVTAEALASSLPTIGFASCPGTNVLISDQQNGVLVDDLGLDEDDPRRIRLLAEGMITIMSDSNLRNALSARAAASVKRYSPDAILPQWIKLLSSE